MRLFTRFVPFVLALTAVGCTDRPLTTEMETAVWAISDAEHDGLDGFYFLPPMVPAPSPTGVFDETFSPVVTVDDRDATTQIAEYTMTTGHGSETVRVVPEDEHYIVNWHVDEFGLDATHTYRISVSVDAVELGYADVDVVSNGSELKNVETGEYVALKDGRTLPIKFRIEEGALLVLGPGGGILTAAGEAVTMGFAPDAVSAPVGLTVEPSTDFPDAEYLVPNTVFDFGPDGLVFAEPATLTITYDEADLPAGLGEENLELHKLVDGVWQPVLGSTVDTEANAVDGAVEGFSTYGAIGVIRLPLPLAQLLFASDRDGDWDIYMMYPDGSGLTQLTDDDGTDWMPVASRDGSKIAFSSDRDGDFDIYVMNAEGSGLTNITDTWVGEEVRPAWDPQGTRLVYTSNRSGAWQLYLSYVESPGHSRAIGRPGTPLFKSGASWRGNDRVYYHTEPGVVGMHDIYTMNVYDLFPSSDRPTGFPVNTGADELYPQWSFNFSEFAFSSDRTGDFDIFVYRQATSESPATLTNLTNDPAIDTGRPAWSPDASFIAFERFADEVSTGDIYIVRPDGTGLQQITSHPADDRMPAWRRPG